MGKKHYKTSSWVKDGIWNYGDGVSFNDMKSAYLSGDFSKVSSYLTLHKDLADYLNKLYESRGGNKFTPATPIKGTPGYGINVSPDKVSLSVPNGLTTDITESKNVALLILQGNRTPSVNYTIGTLNTVPTETAVTNVSRVNNLIGADGRITFGTPVSYNRSLTRDIMRLNYLNPYDYSSSERRAFRHIINNDEGDWSGADLIVHDARINNRIVQSLVGTDYERLVNPTLKFQLGGSMQDKVVEAFKQWVAQKIQNGEVQESDLKDLNKVKQLFQTFQLELSKTQSAKMGAKLDYVNLLNGRCPQGTHLTYHKVGGTICKRCEADVHNEDPDPIKAFKLKCGGKVKKKEIGGEMADDNKDSKTKLVKKPKPVVKKLQSPPPTNHQDNKRPGPKDLKTLPNGKYPSYWTPRLRGEWDSMHPEEAV